MEYLIDPGDLSPVQEDILPLVVKGLTNREIGKELGFTEKTIKNYMLDILPLFGVRSRTELAVRLIQLGRVSVPVVPKVANRWMAEFSTVAAELEGVTKKLREISIAVLQPE